MTFLYTYLKNSNTGDIIKKQEFSDLIIKGNTIFYYRNHNRIINPDLTGYIEIKEKRAKKLLNKIK
ncbi:hypothetical protein LCGC14_2319130 [marine sediment metagenome]|uniref:Uncharacterized protein n=1 Tax=marine sediment metagenome TaxID=412755 RepID=A0A0F9CIE8_9ZZZZ